MDLFFVGTGGHLGLSCAGSRPQSNFNIYQMIESTERPVVSTKVCVGCEVASLVCGCSGRCAVHGMRSANLCNHRR